MKLKKFLHKDIVPQSEESLVKGGAINTKKNKKGIVLYWIMLILGILFLVTIFAVGGLTFLFVFTFFLWFVYIYNVVRSINLGVFSFEKMIIFGIIILILSVLVIDAAPSDKPSQLDILVGL